MVMDIFDAMTLKRIVETKQENGVELYKLFEELSIII